MVRVKFFFMISSCFIFFLILLFDARGTFLLPFQRPSPYASKRYVKGTVLLTTFREGIDIKRRNLS